MRDRESTLGNNSGSREGGLNKECSNMLRKMFCGLALASVMTIGCGPKAEPEKKMDAAPAAGEAAPADAAAPAAPAEAAPAEEKKEG
jgi:hypothetical protein